MDTKLRLGVIGVGGMGGAIVRGIVGDVLASEQVWVTDVLKEKADSLSEQLGVNAVTSVQNLVENVDCVLYAAKPNNVAEILPEIAETLQSPPQFLISIAAGVPIATFESYFSTPTAIVRVMPNLAVSAKASIAVIALGQAVTEEQLTHTQTLFNALGQSLVMDEKYLNAVTGLSGSGPAFVFLFIEALADAAVHVGLPRQQANQLALHTVIGACQVLKQTGEHPAVLKNLVTTPGGTTTAGLHELEKGRLRALVTDAVTAATNRAEELADS